MGYSAIIEQARKGQIGWESQGKVEPGKHRLSTMPVLNNQPNNRSSTITYHDYQEYYTTPVNACSNAISDDLI
jgi:hypothetical protein